MKDGSVTQVVRALTPLRDMEKELRREWRRSLTQWGYKTGEGHCSVLNGFPTELPESPEPKTKKSTASKKLPSQVPQPVPAAQEPRIFDVPGNMKDVALICPKEEEIGVQACLTAQAAKPAWPGKLIDVVDSRKSF